MRFATHLEYVVPHVPWHARYTLKYIYVFIDGFVYRLPATLPVRW